MTQFGRVIATGTPVEIALVRKALDECVNLSIPLEDLLPRDYTIAFKTPKEMIDAGAIIPGSKSKKRPKGRAAYGYVQGPALLWINSSYAARNPRDARHVVRHELGHIMPLTLVKRAELMALMEREDGTHPTVWRGRGYEVRPSESFADTFAEAISGIDSPFDEYAFFDLQIPTAQQARLIEIALRPDTAPPLPEPPPEPLPINPLAARVAELEGLLRDIKGKAETGIGGGT